MKVLIWPCLIFATLIACSSPNEPESERQQTENSMDQPINNTEDSDPKAVEIARAVLRANGGHEAWDTTRYVAWDFFGSRRLIWDKHKDRARIDFLKEPLSIVVDLQDTSGQVLRNGQLIQDSLDFFLRRGYRVWINDSYWLVLPFKLLDPGVRLRYLGQDSTESDIVCDVIEMTYEGVGVTPQNKYHVWVSDEGFIRQWSYYPSTEDEEPRFTMPWDQYSKVGDLMLSGYRGENRQLTKIQVYQDLPDNVFDVEAKHSF